MNAARLIGESASPYSVCGRVPIISPYATYVPKNPSMLIRAPLLVREARGRRSADPGRGEELRRNHSGEVGVDADQLRWRRLGRRRVGAAAGHRVDDDPAPVAALRG